MHKVIIKHIIDVMGEFGLVESIVISQDWYQVLTDDQIEDIEAYLPSDQEQKWTILTREKQFYSFLYRSPPLKK